VWFGLEEFAIAFIKNSNTSEGQATGLLKAELGPVSQGHWFKEQFNVYTASKGVHLSGKPNCSHLRTTSELQHNKTLTSTFLGHSTESLFSFLGPMPFHFLPDALSQLGFLMER
jgi:hypothetical protein